MSEYPQDMAPDRPVTRPDLVLKKLKVLRTELLASLEEARRAAEEAYGFLSKETILLDEYAQEVTMDQAVDVWTLGNRILSLADRYQALVGLADDRPADPRPAGNGAAPGIAAGDQPVGGPGPGWAAGNSATP